MIFELTADRDGDVMFLIFKDEEAWLKVEKEYTIDEDISEEEYLSQFSKDGKGVQIGYWEGRILIKGEIIMPKIKSIVKELDL